MNKPPANHPSQDGSYDIPERGSLGLLALGYRGIVAWRAVRGTAWIEKRRVDSQATQQTENAEGTAPIAESESSVLPSNTLPRETLEPLSLVVVSGLPRSGTSMLMQMLTAGGFTAYTDEEREADPSNPRGYYEHTRVKALAYDHGWVTEADHQVVKVVAPLLSYLPEGPTYRVVFMERGLEEILASQAAMLSRLGHRTGERAVLRPAFERQLASAKAWLEAHPNTEALYVNHRDVIEDPTTQVRRINAFMDGTLDERAMCTVVEPSLHRQHAN